MPKTSTVKSSRAALSTHIAQWSRFSAAIKAEKLGKETAEAVKVDRRAVFSKYLEAQDREGGRDRQGFRVLGATNVIC